MVTVDTPGHAEFAAETARQLIFGQYGDEAYTRGHECLPDAHLGRADRRLRALRRGIMDYERRQVYRGPRPTPTCPPTPRRWIARRRTAGRPPDNDELLAAVVLEADPKKVVAVLQTGETIQITGEGCARDLGPVRPWQPKTRSAVAP